MQSTRIDPVKIGLKLLLMYLRSQQSQPQVQEQAPQQTDSGSLSELRRLKSKAGSLVVILGMRESGKTVLASRFAEYLERPTYMVSPQQKPLSWMKRVELDEIEERVNPGSTLILDDLPVYMSSRDYSNAAVHVMEKIIPVCRHYGEDKGVDNPGLHIIIVSQTSGFADKWVLDADAIFIKPFSILYADLERPAVKKLMDRAAPFFEGQEESWLRRHAYMITNTWEGIVEVNEPSK